MEYKVLIVDDEEIMRDGLANLVKWKTMGFEIVDKLEDGQDAIEYIKKHSVDVILTDIKMTFVSGLEVAKYVFENNLNIKVVLISGYKEFEFAQKAISYNVVHYLLKPVKFKDLSSVFVQIKEQLDTINRNKRLEMQKSTQIDELIMFSRKQFFADAAMGVFSSETEVISRLKLLDFNTDIIQNKCGILNIGINEFDKFVKENWSYNREGLLNAIRNFFIDSNSLIQYYETGARPESLDFVAVQTATEDESFEKELKRQTEEIQLGAKSLLGIDITIKIIKMYDSVLKMAVSPNTNFLQHPFKEKDIEGNDTEISAMLEQQKLIYSHILNNETDIATSIFKKHFEVLSNYGNLVFKKSSIDFFELLISKMRENGINISIEDDEIVNSNEFLKCENSIELLALAERIFNNILLQIKVQTERQEKEIIIRIKKYIADHYNEDITLEDVAEYVFLSPVYLSRMFKEQAGEYFSDYKVKIKMEKAVEMLRNPNYKVYDVGRLLGYNNTKYFYKIFKRYKGCTPTEYRKNRFIDGADSNE